MNVWLPPDPEQVVYPGPRSMHVKLSERAGISFPRQQVMTAAVAMVALMKFMGWWVMVSEALCLRSGRFDGDATQLIPDHVVQGVV